MSKHIEKFITWYFNKNNLSLDSLTMDDLCNLLKAARSSHSLWNNIDIHPSICANEKICVLVKYGEEKFIECIYTSDFDEFITTHNCIKWINFDKLINIKDKSVWETL